MRLIDADAMASALDPLVLVEALREAHRDGGFGQVERVLIEKSGTGNAVLTWLAWHPKRGVAVRRRRSFPATAAQRFSRTSSRS